MKILIIMGGFFPGKKLGGPPVSVDNFCSMMKEHECYIYTCNHDLGETESYSNVNDGWNDRGNCKVMYVPDSKYNYKSFARIIREIEPDVLYLQGLFQSCIVPCLVLAKKNKIPVLLAPRGELCAGALNLKKWKKVPYICVVKFLGLVRNIHWQSTSDEETVAIKSVMNADDGHVHALENIPSIPKKEYIRREKKAGEARFVFLSRIHPKKNLLSAIKYFHNIKGKAVFDIYGPIEDENYWKDCQAEIETLPDNVVVSYKGLVEHDQVHEVFSRYDAFLFPTLSENYGHVIAESLIVGTPVIISDQTPWRKLYDVNAGWDIALSDASTFICAMEDVIEMDNEKMNQTSNSAILYAKSHLKLNELKKKYQDVILDMIINHK